MDLNEQIKEAVEYYTDLFKLRNVVKICVNINYRQQIVEANKQYYGEVNFDLTYKTAFITLFVPSQDPKFSEILPILKHQMLHIVLFQVDELARLLNDILDANEIEFPVKNYLDKTVQILTRRLCQIVDDISQKR